MLEVVTLAQDDESLHHGPFQHGSRLFFVGQLHPRERAVGGELEDHVMECPAHDPPRIGHEREVVLQDLQPIFGLEHQRLSLIHI